jgi:hypothetical protein
MMFVIVDFQTVIRKFYIPTSSSSLHIAVKYEAEENLLTVSMFVVLYCTENYLDVSCIFFVNLLSYVTSASWSKWALLQLRPQI